MIRVTALCCALLVLTVAVNAEGQDPITDAIKADMAIKDAIFHKTTTPESSVPSPYVPADVIVTVPITELPVTAPPTTTGPAPPSTTPPPTTPSCRLNCTATQYVSSSCTCVACGAASASAPNGTCNTGSPTIVGGRCNGRGSCVGTPVSFCLSTAKVACVNNAAYTQSAYCDAPADPATVAAVAAYKASQGSTSTVTGVLVGAYVKTNPACNRDIDCPIGYFCDGYSGYASAGFTGQCVTNC
ncbi:g4597 [Coccomyxa elongata]